MSDQFLFDFAEENHNIEGLTYIENYLTPIEEIFLLQLIDKENWLNNFQRRVQHHGYKYDYKARKVTPEMYLGPLPRYLQKFANKLVDDQHFTETPDQAIINEYIPGQGISKHIDCEPCFADTIASISLGSPCIMRLTANDESKEETNVFLERRSVILLQGKARYNYLHEIPARKTDHHLGNKIQRERRVSITFRKVLL